MATILIVDDEDAVRRLVVAVLEGAGYQTMTAINGLEGVAVFRSQPAGIDLVLTDMTMPVMNGFEAVARIRETNPAVRVICMSGYTTTDLPRRVLFLQKPFTPAKLLERVREALGS